VCSCLALAVMAEAAPHEVRVPLQNGKLRPAELGAVICREMHLPSFKLPRAESTWAAGRIALCARLECLSWRRMPDQRRARRAGPCTSDTDKLPANLDDAHRAIRIFTGQVAPDATARQAKHWGLFLPENLDDHRLLVVLIHGLDSSWGELSVLGT